MEKLVQKVTSTLKNKKKTISAAESCTGGLLSHILTSIPGSSLYFKLGIIAYSNEAKITQLNIPPNLLKQHGAVSKNVAILMAENIKKISHTDISLSTTGIAGPTRGNSKMPVGLIYISITSENKTTCRKFNFKGKRLDNINNTVKEVLIMLKKFL